MNPMIIPPTWLNHSVLTSNPSLLPGWLDRIWHRLVNRTKPDPVARLLARAVLYESSQPGFADDLYAAAQSAMPQPSQTVRSYRSVDSSWSPRPLWAALTA